MSGQKIISREYKLVLQKLHFAGNGSEPVKKANEFLEALRKNCNLVIKGKNFSATKKRQIRFYDTSDFALNARGYIVRLREYSSSNERELTLKFRHPDRFVSEQRDMSCDKKRNAETKFEEDIKAPFISLYSFSTTQTIGQNKKSKSVQHLIRLYPGLSGEIGKEDREKDLTLVNGQFIDETVITGPAIRLSSDPAIAAECALILWQQKNENPSAPAIVEFSFRYGDKKQRYGRDVAQKAFEIFTGIQKNMKEWIEKEGMTKTGFVYDND